MSHFSVLVIGPNPEAQLQPYHEFECTGDNDAYVQDVDITDKVKEEIAECYAETGDENGALDYGLDYYGLKERQLRSVDEHKVDRQGVHKFGYALVDQGELIKAVQRTNPNKKWDWYSIGGRWTGWMKLKPYAAGEIGSPGLMTPPAKPGTADQTILQNIDIEGIRDEEGAKAAERYDEMLRLTDQKGIPAITEVWGELTKREDLTWDQRRGIYHGQPTMVAFKAMTKKAWEEWERQGKPERTALGRLVWSDDPAEFILTREECIQAAREQAFVPFALVKDGQWFEKGEMGWWACVSGGKEQTDWNREVSKLLDGLDPETLITVIDCHI